jgi:hypothetical protein
MDSVILESSCFQCEFEIVIHDQAKGVMIGRLTFGVNKHHAVSERKSCSLSRYLFHFPYYTVRLQIEYFLNTPNIKS